jgi:hypothetical protein
MPKILAIYEEIPDTTFIAALDVTPEELSALKPFNRSFINSTDLTEGETDFLSAFGERVKEAAREEDDTSGGTFDAVILFGFVL